MVDEQLKKTMQALAHDLVRNDMVTEHFLTSLGVSRGEIGTILSEVDDQLRTHSNWHSRFPGLFEE